MVIFYFSATGNTKYIAKLLGEKMDANHLSIESEIDFTSEIKSHDTLVFCYPIYGSRIPRIMREFVAKHMSDINGKKIVILVTQMLFSGDGARVFMDMFWDDTIDVIYAEHIRMPNNICNTPFLRAPSRRKIEKYKRRTNKKLNRISRDIENGITRKRGFSKFSQWLGNIQGKVWQGESKDTVSQQTFELRAKNGVKIHRHCIACGLCVKICPMRNLSTTDDGVCKHDNCTACYRCVNRCPKKAITVLFHKIPKWQYKGLNNS